METLSIVFIILAVILLITTIVGFVMYAISNSKAKKVSQVIECQEEEKSWMPDLSNPNDFTKGVCV
jgi:uncharacterized membrane protein YsdA (DUF1294 family)